MLLRDQEAIIQRHQRSAPVKVVRIAHALGLKVYSTSTFNDDVSGMIRRDEKRGGDSGYAIFVNASHVAVRRRFTIAHEIAHFILHKNLIGDGIVEDALLRAGGLSNAIEREANAKAADILMPWHLIKELQLDGTNSVAELASVLNVSRDAMSYRLLGVSYSEAQALGRN